MVYLNHLQPSQYWIEKIYNVSLYMHKHLYILVVLIRFLSELDCKSFLVNYLLFLELYIHIQVSYAIRLQVFVLITVHRTYYKSPSTPPTRTIPVKSNCMRPFFCSFKSWTSSFNNPISLSAVERILAIFCCSSKYVN